MRCVFVLEFVQFVLLIAEEPPAALLAPKLQRMRVGETKPMGWLKDELTLQARGLTSQLPYFWPHILSIYPVSHKWIISAIVST